MDFQKIAADFAADLVDKRTAVFQKIAADIAADLVDKQKAL